MTYQTVSLGGSSTSTSAKEMAAVSWSRTITSALGTLGRACEFAELLAVVFTLTPATLFTCLVTLACWLRHRKIVGKSVGGVRISHNLPPFNRLHVA